MSGVHNDDAETDTEGCRPASRALGRRTRIGFSTRCSVPSAHTQSVSVWGDDPVAVSYRRGHRHSARVWVKVRHPLLMEWAGAGS